MRKPLAILAMLRPILPVPTNPSVRPARSSPSHRGVGPGPALRVHLAPRSHQLLGERDHQREGAFGDRLLGIFRHIHDRDAARHGGRDVDCVDADAVFDDAFEPQCGVNDARRDRGVAHQQEVSVAYGFDQRVLADALGQRDEFYAARDQSGVDVGHSSSRSVLTALNLPP